MTSPVLDPVREFYDKWQMHQLLSQESTGPAKLLATEVLRSQSLWQMLQRFRSVYIKPLGTWGGKQISRIDRRPKGWLWRQQGTAKAVTVHSFVNLRRRVLAAHPEGTCVIQQAAPVLTLQGHPFDLRVHLQREPGDRQWAFAGMLVRVSGAKSIVSNVGATQGSVLPLEEVTQVVLKHPVVRNQVALCAKETGLAIAHSLDRYHAFEEIGVDLGLGKWGRLWLFEVNTNDLLGSPSQKLFSQLPDPSVYARMRERTPHRIPT